jgi:hypothetical protein
MIPLGVMIGKNLGPIPLDPALECLGQRGHRQRLQAGHPRGQVGQPRFIGLAHKIHQSGGGLKRNGFNHGKRRARAYGNFQ